MHNYPSLAHKRAANTNLSRSVLLGLYLVAFVALRAAGVPIPAGFFVVVLLWLATSGIVRLLARVPRSPQIVDNIGLGAWLADLTFLSAVYLQLGGGWWLGVPLHVMYTIFPYATLPRKRAIVVTVYAVAVFVALLTLETTGMLRPAPFMGLPSLAGRPGLAWTIGVFGTLTIVGCAAAQHAFVRIMRRAQERFRRLVQTAPDLIISTDRQGIIVGANEAAYQLVAAARGQREASRGRRSPLGQPIALLAHPDDRERFGADVVAVAQDGGQGRRGDVRMDGPAGVELLFACTYTPLCEDDRVTGVLVVARDETRRRRNEEALRRSEEQLRHSQKMEAVGRLAGGVAHDFNNLLTVISSYSELLLRGLADGNARVEDVEEIQTASARAAALTKQLLAFSRKQVLKPRLMNLNDSVAEMERLLRRLLSGSIHVETRLFANLPSIRADPSQMEQVLLNLALNARDAMPDGGRLTIETDLVFLDAEYVAGYTGMQPGPRVLLSVSDTGDGMDEETRARVFEPFFTTKPQGQGTGLGLATVYGIVQQSGGHITVESALGAGTWFRTYLPVASAAETAAVRETTPAAPVDAVRDTTPAPSLTTSGPAARLALPGGAETVLLVEDGEALREVLERILVGCGYTVLVAEHGTDALAVSEAHEGKIHIVVTDVVMPEMGGRELAARLWQSRPETRVLFMSGYAEDAILQHGLRRDGVAFIGKPFRPDVLARKVREVLDAEPRPSHATPGVPAGQA